MRDKAFIREIKREKILCTIYFDIVCPECDAEFTKPITWKGGTHPFIDSKKILMSMPDSIDVHCDFCGKPFFLDKIRDGSNNCYGFEVKPVKEKERSMSLREYLIYLSKVSNMTCSTKQEFGRMMHDPSLSDDEKRRIAQEVFMAGGYDGLND